MSVWIEVSMDKMEGMRVVFFAAPYQLSNLFSKVSFVLFGFCGSVFIFHLHFLLAILFKLYVLLIFF
ncbi:hypothetical protein J2T04_001924 [Chryseobacterium lathyri]|uniref:Uncharacterized protein n=1 Tax=Chryseobacterium lathyri TaxID=395933 RepID=A0ABT9SNR9_9FLAO|nr:hypothetical protein [Chryseobacterium lathyri]